CLGSDSGRRARSDGRHGSGQGPAAVMPEGRGGAMRGRVSGKTKSGAASMQRRVVLLAGLLALAVVASFRPEPVIEAHALLARSDPPANSQLRQPPEVLTLYFTEPLEQRFSNVRVLDQTG